MEDRIIEWDERYSVGIPFIDEQHRELIKMTNILYMGCLQGREISKGCFRAIIHGLVDYVRYHFTAEEQLMEKMRYPDFSIHRRQHENFIREILARVKDFEDDKPLVPNTFVRYLRDWILTHIAFVDKRLWTQAISAALSVVTLRNIRKITDDNLHHNARITMRYLASPVNITTGIAAVIETVPVELRKRVLYPDFKK